MDVNTHFVYEEPPSREISGYHSSVAEESGLLGCDSVLLHGKLPEFHSTFFADCVTLEDKGTNDLSKCQEVLVQ